MGCDIHLYVEVKKYSTWESADTWETDNHGDKFVPYEKRLFTGRNYNLFSILANVRNRYKFIPITDPKGLPNDVSEPVKNQSKNWEGNSHSHSFLTVQEILEFDWTQTVTLKGFLTAIGYYEIMRLKNDPNCYCGGVFGPNIQIISNQEMEEKINQVLNDSKELSYQEIEEKIMNDLQFFYTEYKWTLPYYKTSTYFWSNTIPKLLKLGKPEDIRLVFWFDN